MAKLSSKQLNTKITGSYTFSGSSHTFIGDVTASNNISASVSSTGSFGYLEGITFGTSAQANITGSFLQLVHLSLQQLQTTKQD